VNKGAQNEWRMCREFMKIVDDSSDAIRFSGFASLRALTENVSVRFNRLSRISRDDVFYLHVRELYALTSMRERFSGALR
jgi:hypothetical protein